MNQFIIKRAHLRPDQPSLRGSAGIDRVRDPSQRLGDGCRKNVLGRDGGHVSVKLILLHDVQRGGRHVVALLITRRYQSRLWMHADERLA